MLDHKAKFDKRNIQLDNDELSVQVNDSPDFNISLKIVINNQSISNASLSLIANGKDIPDCNMYINYKDELNELLKYYEQYQNSPEYLSKLSSVYKWLGEKEKAISTSKKILDLSSENVYEILHAELLNEFDQSKEAESLFAQVSSKKDVRSNLRMAYFKFQESDLTETMSYLSHALEADPLNYAVRLFLGTIHLSTGNYDVAIRNFRIAQDEIYFSSALHTNIALAYTMKGMLHKAFKESLIALNIEPMNFSALRILADVAQELSLQETSIRYLNNYIGNCPNKSKAYSLLARAYFSLGADDVQNRKFYLNAFNTLRKEYKLEPSATILNNMGLTSWKLKNFDVAYKTLNRSISEAIKQGFIFSIPIFNLVGMLISEKKFKEALAYLDSFLDMQVKPDDRLYLDLRLQKIVCLEALQQYEASNDEVISLLSEDVREDIRCDLLVKAIYHYSAIENNKNAAIQYIEQAKEWIDRNGKVTESLRQQLVNNLIFALITYDELLYARNLFPLISNITKSPFPCATLGMFHLRKGEIAKGEKYYTVAISMLSEKKDKDRFRLKLRYEKALFFYRTENYDRALKILDRTQKYEYLSGWLYKDAVELNKEIRKRLLN